MDASSLAVAVGVVGAGFTAAPAAADDDDHDDDVGVAAVDSAACLWPYVAGGRRVRFALRAATDGARGAAEALAGGWRAGAPEDGAGAAGVVVVDNTAWLVIRTGAAMVWRGDGE